MHGLYDLLTARSCRDPYSPTHELLRGVSRCHWFTAPSPFGNDAGGTNAMAQGIATGRRGRGFAAQMFVRPSLVLTREYWAAGVDLPAQRIKKNTGVHRENSMSMFQ